MQEFVSLKVPDDELDDVNSLQKIFPQIPEHPLPSKRSVSLPTRHSLVCGS